MSWLRSYWLILFARQASFEHHDSQHDGAVASFGQYFASAVSSLFAEMLCCSVYCHLCGQERPLSCAFRIEEQVFHLKA